MDSMTDMPAPAPPRLFGGARILGALRAQRWMWSEAFCKWRRRPLPSMDYARRLGDGQRFELHRGPWMGVLVPMVVFSQLVDVLIAQGGIHVIAAGNERIALHAALLFVSLWTVVWAVSLRSAMRHVDHRLDPEMLTLALGFKQLCRIPLAAIAEVRVIDHKAARNGGDWYDTCKLRPREVSVLAFLDQPGLLIALKDGAAGACWTRNGVRKPLKRWIAAYVDQPAAMQAAIAAALPPLEAPQP
jgi:hypothetical protein